MAVLLFPNYLSQSPLMRDSRTGNLFCRPSIERTISEGAAGCPSGNIARSFRASNSLIVPAVNSVVE